MSEKILCPYCGEWNGHPDGVEMKLQDDGNEIEPVTFWYECCICGNMSPAKITLEEARAAALRRFTPMQKPLSLEEVFRHIDSENERPLCIEFNPPAPWERKWRAAKNIRWYVQTNPQGYNRYYRFWREDPTDEERQAAGWENA